uniref:Transient receptor potential cation channel subfamily M member 1-like n=1 Tax=Phallusia mammillata TaxID=59560 RepID=A0A6F9DW89_9ASCI|nr:transient receptor potential cation channel subfamily M member 1-like [Phallusia mammillata]
MIELTNSRRSAGAAASRTNSVDEVEEKSWIELTFRKRECFKFIPAVPATDGLSRCGCGRILSDHHYLNQRGVVEDEEILPLGATAGNFQKQGKKNKLLPKPVIEMSILDAGKESSQKDSKWSITQHTSLFPTDAYGTLEFQGTGEGDKSKYIRLSQDTSNDLVLQLLMDEWKLRPPKMVITVHGGAHNFQLQPKLHRVFCNGLVKAAKTTGAWIMSFGLNTGVGAIVGNALKEHKARSRGKIISIGVAPWGVVDHREDLVGSQPISAYQTMDNPISKGSVLHAAHTHFLLVDNGTEGRYDSELRFRRHLERRLSQQQLMSRHARTCPVVCLVLEGGKNTINVVLESVRQSPPIPVIVCDGSGRAADLIAFAHQYTDDEGIMIEELREQLLVLVQKTFKCSKEQAQYIFISILECVKKKELITIFRMGQGYNQDDIDMSILTATLKAQCKSAPDMLNLAMTWNRIDIATSQIFVYGRQWPVMSLEQAMMDALISDRVDFVKLLMENGVSMHKFLTITRLEELYNAKPPLNLVYLINDVKKNITPGYRFTLIDIGQVVELLMGGAYRSSYTRKRFRLHYSMKADNGMRKQLSIKMGLNAFGTSTSFHKTDSFLRSGIETPTSQRKVEPPPIPLPHFAYPFHELLIWAVLMKRQKMALFMWQQGEEAIAKALVACKLYKTMAKEAADDDLDVEESDQLKKYSMEFHNLALQMLEICYRADDDATQHLLTYELKQWSRHTCLSLAVIAKHREFIAHPCVQLLLNDLWMGGLSERKNSGLKVICGILIPISILMFAFKSQEELQLMPQTVEEHLHEVSSASSSVEGSSSTSTSSSSSSSSSQSSNSTIVVKPEVLGRPPSDHQIQDAYTILATRAKQLTLSKKIYEFYNAPITKFWMYVMTYSILLVLFTYVVLVNMDFYPSIPEWVVISHAATMALEKGREIVLSAPGTTAQKLKVWGSNFWNLLDAVTICMFFIGFGLRISQDHYIMMIGRAVYCANIVLWYVHLLNIFSVNKHLGPYVMMMGKMMVDLGTFIILLAVVLISFGVSRQAILHPNQNASWTLLKDSVLEPYFMLYGEVYAGTIDPCHGDDPSLCVVGSWIAPTFMTIYLLVANILLLNLLIAVFNNTYARVKSYSDKIWKFQRYLTIVEFELRPVLPPPLILLSYVVMILQRLCKKRKNVTSDRGLKLFLDEEDVEKLHDFEEECVDEFFRGNNISTLGESIHNDKQKSDEKLLPLERLLDTMEDMCEREILLTNQIDDLNERLAHLEDINIKLLGRHISGSSANLRSRQNTGRTESLSETDRYLPAPSELGPLPETSAARAWMSLRHRSRIRQDSEMSSASDWHPINFGNSRTRSCDKSKTSILPKLEKPLRRTNSTGVLADNKSDNLLQVPSDRSKFGFTTQMSMPDDELKSLSCQDIMLASSEHRMKFMPASGTDRDGNDQAAPIGQRSGSSLHRHVAIDEDVTQQRYDDAASQCSGVWLSDPAPKDTPPPQRTTRRSNEITPPRSSLSCFELSPVSEGAGKSHFENKTIATELPLLNGLTDVATSSVSKNNRPKLSLTSNASFDKSSSMKKRYNATPTLSIRPSPGLPRPHYKSITDTIDTSRWHEIYAPLAPQTPFDCWWKEPDFDSTKPIRYSDQTSLSEWEDCELDNSRRKSKKHMNKHKKHMHRKRDKLVIAELEEDPSVSKSVPTTPRMGRNVNNNATDPLCSTATFPRSRSHTHSLRKSYSQTSCVDSLRLLPDD